VFDADLPDAFEQRLATRSGQVRGRDVLDVFVALARDPIVSDEASSVEYEVVRIEAGSQPAFHSIGLKREIAYFEQTPSGGENTYSYFNVEMTFARAPAEPAARADINYGEDTHPGRDLDLEEVLAAVGADERLTALLDHAVLEWHCWLDY
jgi:hypothetical protein